MTSTRSALGIWIGTAVGVAAIAGIIIYITTGQRPATMVADPGVAACGALRDGVLADPRAMTTDRYRGIRDQFEASTDPRLRQHGTEVLDLGWRYADGTATDATMDQLIAAADRLATTCGQHGITLPRTVISIATPSLPAPVTTGPAAAVPDVVELMATAGCVGEVIGTQLYAAQTGRCRLAGGEVTIATFTSGQLRDQWVAAGRSLGVGGAVVVGDGWAAWAEQAAAGRALADVLGGSVLVG